MAGCVIPYTPIAVDYWKRRNARSKICFLSHIHADHTQGLCASSAPLYEPIYCSEITRRLAIKKLNIDPAVLIAIPIGEPTIISLDNAGIETMTVTLIDANHCAGAVMFLFQGYFGCVLYTGDFRYFDGMLDVHPFTNNIAINTLYLDNTYCDPQCEFPSKNEAKEMILEIIHNNPEKDLLFGLETVGKEELLRDVAIDQGYPVAVDTFRFGTAEEYGCKEYFTLNRDETFIRVEKKSKVNKSSLGFLNRKIAPTIGIIPSALYSGRIDPFASCESIFVVPYSDHSSFSELKQFVAKLKPQRIIPIVSKRTMDEHSHDRTDMSIFSAEMSCDAGAYFVDVPPTVQAFMSGNNNTDCSRRKAPSSYFHGISKRPCGIVFSPESQTEVSKNNEKDANVTNESEKDVKVNGKDACIISGGKIVVAHGDEFTEHTKNSSPMELDIKPEPDMSSNIRNEKKGSGQEIQLNNNVSRHQESNTAVSSFLDTMVKSVVKLEQTNELGNSEAPLDIAEKVVHESTKFDESPCRNSDEQEGYFRIFNDTDEDVRIEVHGAPHVFAINVDGRDEQSKVVLYPESEHEERGHPILSNLNETTHEEKVDCWTRRDRSKVHKQHIADEQVSIKQEPVDPEICECGSQGYDYKKRAIEMPHTASYQNMEARNPDALVSIKQERIGCTLCECDVQERSSGQVKSFSMPSKEKKDRHSILNSKGSSVVKCNSREASPKRCTILPVNENANNSEAGENNSQEPPAKRRLLESDVSAKPIQNRLPDDEVECGQQTKVANENANNPDASQDNSQQPPAKRRLLEYDVSAIPIQSRSSDDEVECGKQTKVTNENADENTNNPEASQDSSQQPPTKLRLLEDERPKFKGTCEVSYKIPRTGEKSPMENVLDMLIQIARSSKPSDGPIRIKLHK